ncbi:MAG: hypothetical protein RTV72_02475 [Candidatus Thorarchaeota archaeon]
MGSALLLVTTLVLLVIASGIGTASAEDDLVAVRGENVTISVILLQNGTYGNPVPEQRIEFFDQTNNLLLGVDVTDSNGLASIDWNIPIEYPLGPTIVNATFRGNESIFLVPSSQSIVLNILASTEIVLLDTPTILAPGDTLSFSVILLDDTSTPISDRNILVYNDGLLLSTSVTNSTGGASFSIQCNDTWSELGENILQIIHDQDIGNYYERAEILFSIEIQKLQTSIYSNSSPNSITLGDTLDFDIVLETAEGGISTTLEVQLDGSPLTTTTTDSIGSGTIHLGIDERFALGIHYLNIIYNGSERYTESSFNIEIDISSPSIIELQVDSSAVIGFDTDITILLCDILGRPIDGTISISDISSGRNTSIQIPHDTTNINIKLPIWGPAGLHNILIEIENPYVTNNSIMYNMIVWSQPEFTLQHSNILHFASPNQNLTFIVQLTDWSGNISLQSIHLLYDGEMLSSSVTNDGGIAIITTIAPDLEGIYNLSIIYPENLTRYELSTKLDYEVTVSLSIPVLVELDYYEVIPPLQKITIHLKVQCLNGSLIEGIQIKISWESIEGYAVTQQGGTSAIHVPVPDTSGNYTLYYEIEQTHNLASSTGAINIPISLVDVLTSQGIGINGFILGILTALVIVAIPLIRQRYLMI